MTWRPTLSQRLSAVFAVLLLACCAASVWLQVRASVRHEQEVTQRLSMGLAAHIAGNTELVQAQGINPRAVHDLFGKLMDVNPSVEVYLLTPDGHIAAQDAPDGHVKRDRVDLAPVKRLLAGEPLPVLGDDPRSTGAQKVFSAAPLQRDGRAAGYVYVVLQGEDRDALADRLAADSALRTAVRAMAVVAALGLVAGLIAFRSVTAPLRALTREVQRFHADGASPTLAPGDAPGAASVHGARGTPDAAGLPRVTHRGDEIATLRLAHTAMQQRIALQWQALARQDQQRREMVANISHDLRTPLTSLHGYLETLRLKADTLTDGERRRYLDVAIDQSRKVGRLAQELFELARLEYGGAKPAVERFSLPELLQDVLQKFELSAEARQQRLVAEVAADLPAVQADLGMIERVLTNLLDNAIRHTPPAGVVTVQLRRGRGGVDVEVSDNGPGLPEEVRAHLFQRPSHGAGVSAGGGGLGLLIVHRILALHGSDIRLLPSGSPGTVFAFSLAA